MDTLERGTVISLPSSDHDDDPSEEVLSLHAGADHFLVRTTRSLYGLGDNRFGQLGIIPPLPQPSSTEAQEDHHGSSSGRQTQSSISSLTRIDFFDGLSPIVAVAAGDVHSAVVTEDGALYVFGHDGKGQCGGWTSETGEPTLVQLEDENGEPVDVCAVSCGSQNTVVITSDGGVWSSGASRLYFLILPLCKRTALSLFIFSYATTLLDDFGQLGLGDRQPRKSFERSELLAAKGKAKNLICSRWTTYVQTDSTGE
jgi:hypothetical protein